MSQLHFPLSMDKGQSILQKGMGGPGQRQSPHLLQLQQLQGVRVKINGRVDGTHHERHLHLAVTTHVRSFQVQPALGKAQKQTSQDVPPCACSSTQVSSRLPPPFTHTKRGVGG